MKKYPCLVAQSSLLTGNKQPQPELQQSPKQHQESTLPRPLRIGQWRGSILNELMEGTLLVRTDMVLGVYHHDISQWQNIANTGKYTTTLIQQLNPQTVVIFHCIEYHPPHCHFHHHGQLT